MRKIEIILVTLLIFSCNVPISNNRINNDNNKIKSSELILRNGDFYFTIDNNNESFIYSRNVTGTSSDIYNSIFSWQMESGSKLVRIHITHGFGIGITSEGEIDPEWISIWDKIFDDAEQKGISIIPVFSVWADFNDSSNEWSNWKDNPLNQINGGPGSNPAELLQNSTTRDYWINWIKSLIIHWDNRNNIAAWEIFSEMDLISGVSENSAISFIEKVSAEIKSVDSHNRPITASLCANPTWNEFNNSPALDIIQVHLYQEDLDLQIISEVAKLRKKYNKPVLIGESGLSSTNPESGEGSITTDPDAIKGIRHSIWASMVSGALNGRSLWWEDSYAIYHNSLGFSFISQYSNLENIAAQFVSNIDFSDFYPMNINMTSDISGGLIGNGQTSFIGWFKDSDCISPDWPTKNIANQSISFVVQGEDRNFKAEFFNPINGTYIGSFQSSIIDNQITIQLPDFTDSIAVKIITSEISSNLIENGEFIYGLTNWTLSKNNGVNANAKIVNNICQIDSFSNLRDHYVFQDARYDISLQQNGFTLQQGITYTLKFDAWSEDNKNISINITENNRDIDGDGNLFSWYYPSAIYSLSNIKKTYSITFTMRHADDNDVLLSFGLSDNDNNVYIDNISLIPTKVVNPKISENLIKNGEFFNNLDYWEYWIDINQGGNAYPIIIDNYLYYNINYGGTGSFLEISQGGLILEAGKSYTLSFNAWSSGSKLISIVIDENGFDHNNDGELYSQWFPWTNIFINSISNNYTYNFTMPNSVTDYNARLKFFAGESDQPLILDNITLIKKN